MTDRASSDSLQDFEDLFEHAPCGYISAGPDGRILKVNETFRAWTGFTRDDLIGRRFSELLNIGGRIYYETHFAPLLRMQGVFNEVALDIVRADGERLPVLVNAIERRDPAGELQFVRVTVFNATDRRRYERELVAARSAAERARDELNQLNATLEARVEEAIEERLRAEDALRQAQKLEAIGQLTGGVAHDFNNLLTIIIGGLELVGRQLNRMDRGPDTERIQRGSEMALQGARRAATLVARLLAFSRRQPLEPKPVNPNRLLSGLADLLQRTLGEAVALETVSAAGLWETLVDPSQLENVLVNLAVNARDAMPEGGRLTIETGNAHLEEAYVAGLVEPVPAGQYVLIAVTDTGVGMERQTLDRVFEPFFTTKDVGKGTGLGLSQVYGFVRQTGGHIRIYSELNQGTTVKLYLPRHRGEAAPLEVESSPAPMHGGRETVLLVEDHDELRAFSSEILRDLGYRVFSAPHGRAALELLQAHADIDLLFTDVVLPEGMDGRQLSSEVSRRRPGIKILFTTGYSRNAIIHNGRLDPGLALLTKPFTSADLAAKVRSVLDG